MAGGRGDIVFLAPGFLLPWLRGEVEADRVDDARAAVPQGVCGAHDGEATACDAVRDQAGAFGQQTQGMPHVLGLDLVGGRHTSLVRGEDAGCDPFYDVANESSWHHTVLDL